MRCFFIVYWILFPLLIRLFRLPPRFLKWFLAPLLFLFSTVSLRQAQRPIVVVELVETSCIPSAFSLNPFSLLNYSSTNSFAGFCNRFACFFAVIHCNKPSGFSYIFFSEIMRNFTFFNYSQILHCFNISGFCIANR